MAPEQGLELVSGIKILQPLTIVGKHNMGEMGKIIHAFFRYFGLFLWKICLNNRFKSSWELFGSILV